jgi:tetratricopeptide (TPR) repeat protein
VAGDSLFAGSPNACATGVQSEINRARTQQIAGRSHITGKMAPESRPVQPVRQDTSAMQTLSPRRALYLGACALGRLGEQSRSLEWAQRALAIDPEDCGILYNVACTYALQGKTEEAINCLEKAMTHALWYKRWALHDSDLDPLRSHPRFQSLMERK